jgi:hypothetical protein
MMTTITAVLLCALLLAAVLSLLRPRLGELLANNALIVSIFPKGRTTRLADASFTARYLLCKAGSDVSHIAICTASDVPLGVVPDMTPTQDTANSELSYPLPVNLLGLNEDTERMIASAAIAVDAFVVPAAAGQIKTLPTSGGGTTYIVGRALTAAAAANDQVNVLPCFPYLITIAT